MNEKELEAQVNRLDEQTSKMLDEVEESFNKQLELMVVLNHKHIMELLDRQVKDNEELNKRIDHLETLVKSIINTTTPN